MTEVLLRKIKTIKNNTDYRLGDVIFHQGFKWDISMRQILNNSIYDDTILKKYLKLNGTKQCDIQLLYRICNQLKHNYIIPDKYTLVIHVRAGDVCVHSWFLKKDYDKLIKKFVDNHENDIKRIVFVIAFSYGEYTERNLWLYTDEKQQQNIQQFGNVLESCINTYPHIVFDIYSNINIDNDLIFCVFSKYFISDEGGFSHLINRLRKYIP